MVKLAPGGGGSARLLLRMVKLAPGGYARLPNDVVKLAPGGGGSARLFCTLIDGGMYTSSGFHGLYCKL